MPRSTTHHFPINLADPRTLGWGGSILEHGKIYGCLVIGSIFTVGMYDKDFGPYLTTTWSIWLPLWIYVTIYCLKRDVFCPIAYAPKSRVICNPLGLTLYNTLARIQHQWRWHELKAVEYQRLPQRCLRIIPQRGSPTTYHSDRLDLDDYKAITTCAQTHINGRSLPLLERPLDDHAAYVWYERRNILGKEYINLDMLCLFIIFLIQPILFSDMKDWLEGWSAPGKLKTIYPLILAFFILLDLHILCYMVRFYFAVYKREPVKQLEINNSGLYFYPLYKSIHLKWLDIRSISYRKIKFRRKIVDLIVIHDRLGNLLEINTYYMRSYTKIGETIVAYTNHMLSRESLDFAILEKELLLNTNKTDNKNRLPLYMKVILFINALYFSIATTTLVQHKIGLDSILMLYQDLLIGLFGVVFCLNLIVPPLIEICTNKID